ncbi:hypothetical protein C1646_751539 [Rhizophagus diaphanus]|nr:hypothetical protein C1646_751539 [Rhizophagus diaphanus] [Rhizophagus sp. MUCL 43196]
MHSRVVIRKINHSPKLNELEYQERVLALKERKIALREREADIRIMELANKNIILNDCTSHLYFY